MNEHEKSGKNFQDVEWPVIRGMFVWPAQRSDAPK